VKGRSGGGGFTDGARLIPSCFDGWLLTLGALLVDGGLHSPRLLTLGALLNDGVALGPLLVLGALLVDGLADGWRLTLGKLLGALLADGGAA
jgi:hypothetical protein